MSNFISLNFVNDFKQGLELAKQKLDEFCDKTTVLFLSGGTTPKPLYEDLAKKELLKVGAVGMVDERFGNPFHDLSNGKMIRDTGLLKFLEKANVPFYPVLRQSLTRNETAEEYDEIIRTLLYNFSKSMAILGIGEDGHTAGIAPASIDFQNPIFNSERKTLLVSEFEDSKSINDGGFGQRITMTFNALEQIDLLLVLAFGKNKKEALGKMFVRGSVEEVPARFFLMPNIAVKTVLITDQKI